MVYRPNKLQIALLFLFIFGGTLLIFQPIQISVLVGDSMEPTIQDGDVFFYTKYSNPEEGDIVRTNSPYDEFGYPVIHRVDTAHGNWVQTKADNRLIADQPVRKKYVTGEVLYVIHVPEKLQFYQVFTADSYDDLEQKPQS